MHSTKTISYYKPCVLNVVILNLFILKSWGCNYFLILFYIFSASKRGAFNALFV